MKGIKLSGHDKEECIAKQISNFLGVTVEITEEYDDCGVDMFLHLKNLFPLQSKSFTFESDKNDGYDGHGADVHLDIGVRESKRQGKRLLIPCMITDTIYPFPMLEVLNALGRQGIWMAPEIIEEIGSTKAQEFCKRFTENFDKYGCKDYRPHTR